MSALLKDKVCLITGGAGSIGLTTARRFAAEGALLALVDRDSAGLARALDELGHDRCIVITADVADANDVRRYVGETVAHFGGLDVLFSNAGNDGPILPATDYPEEMFDLIHRVHVRGTFLACKYAIAAMRDGGSVVITSSVLGVEGVPGNCAYVSAKHALVGLARGIAKEVARREIRVNTVNPGPVDNEFMRTAEEQMTVMLGHNAAAMFDSIIPLGRHVAPAEVAAAVLFLASNESSYTTGSTLMVDGGMSA